MVANLPMSPTYLCHLCTYITYLPTYLDSKLILLDNLMVTYLPTYVTYLLMSCSYLPSYQVCHLRHIHVSHVGGGEVRGLDSWKNQDLDSMAPLDPLFLASLFSFYACIRPRFFALKKGIHLIRGSILHSPLHPTSQPFLFAGYIQPKKLYLHILYNFKVLKSHAFWDFQ